MTKTDLNTVKEYLDSKSSPDLQKVQEYVEKIPDYESSSQNFALAKVAVSNEIEDVGNKSLKPIKSSKDIEIIINNVIIG